MDRYYDHLLNLKQDQIEEYRKAQQLKYEAYESSLALQRKRNLVAEIKHQVAGRKQHIDMLAQFSSGMDDDVKVLTDQLRSRDIFDEEVWDEQRKYFRVDDEIQQEKYLDALEAQLQMVEQERNKTADFMKYIINTNSVQGRIDLIRRLSHEKTTSSEEAS
jgi:hypothetical protein